MTRASIVRRNKDSALPASSTEQKISDTCFLEEWKTKKNATFHIPYATYQYYSCSKCTFCLRQLKYNQYTISTTAFRGQWQNHSNLSNKRLKSATHPMSWGIPSILDNNVWLYMNYHGDLLSYCSIPQSQIAYSFGFSASCFSVIYGYDIRESNRNAE